MNDFIQSTKLGGICDVMFILIGYGFDDQSSNATWGGLYFTLH